MDRQETLEDREGPEDQGELGDREDRVNKTMYGTQDAAANWEAACAKVLTDNGYIRGVASSCHFEVELRVAAGIGVSKRRSGRRLRSVWKTSGRRWGAIRENWGPVETLKSAQRTSVGGSWRPLESVGRVIWGSSGCRLPVKMDPWGADCAFGILDMKFARPPRGPNPKKC